VHDDILIGTPAERRPRGGPSLTWNDNIEMDL